MIPGTCTCTYAYKLLQMPAHNQQRPRAYRADVWGARIAQHTLGLCIYLHFTPCSNAPLLFTLFCCDHGKICQALMKFSTTDLTPSSSSLSLLANTSGGRWRAICCTCSMAWTRAWWRGPAAGKQHYMSHKSSRGSSSRVTRAAGGAVHESQKQLPDPDPRTSPLHPRTPPPSPIHCLPP